MAGFHGGGWRDHHIRHVAEHPGVHPGRVQSLHYLYRSVRVVAADRDRACRVVFCLFAVLRNQGQGLGGGGVKASDVCSPVGGGLAPSTRYSCCAMVSLKGRFVKPEVGSSANNDVTPRQASCKKVETCPTHGMFQQCDVYTCSSPFMPSCLVHYCLRKSAKTHTAAASLVGVGFLSFIHAAQRGSLSPSQPLV